MIHNCEDDLKEKWSNGQALKMLPSKSNTYASSEKSRLVVPLFLNLVQARGSPSKKTLNMDNLENLENQTSWNYRLVPYQY